MAYANMFRSIWTKNSLRIHLLVPLILLSFSGLLAQETKSVNTISGSGAEGRTYTELPAATEPCSVAECEWWNRLRKAANILLQKADQKSKATYVTVFVEGLEKSYRIPLKDMPAKTLAVGPRVQTTNLQAKEKNGTVKLFVELRSDASIGEIKILNGIGPEIDKRCIQAAKNIIFLPAIKDGKFITEWQTSSYNFYHAGWAK